MDLNRRARLLALATRCEAAAKGSRELDAEIDAALHGGTPSHLCSDHTRRSYGPGVVHRHDDGRPVLIEDTRHSPAVTTSLDAALMLVPDGLRWSLDSEPSATIHLPTDPPTCGDSLQAATPALALCAAALRALAAMER